MTLCVCVCVCVYCERERERECARQGLAESQEVAGIMLEREREKVYFCYFNISFLINKSQKRKREVECWRVLLLGYQWAYVYYMLR